MKRAIVLTAFLLLMACAPVPSAQTADPNISLAIAQAQLTGTAQSWAMQQQAWTATAQSWTPTPSLTPVPTATPSITPTPTANITATMAYINAEAEKKKLDLEIERERQTNSIRAWLPYFVAFLALGLAVFFGYVFARRMAMMPTPIHEGTGKPVPMISVIDGVVSDIDRAPNGMAVMNRNYVKALPLITAERQNEVTAMAQASDMRGRSKVTSDAVRRLLDQHGLNKSLPVSDNVLPALSDGENTSFPLPAWELVNGWQGDKNLLPYGTTASGLGFVDVNRFPHWAAIGMTGMGKSRRFLRPIIACALAAGHRVVIVGKMTDYAPFANHPNAVLAHVNQMTKPEHAERYGNILLALLSEMERRDEYLTRGRFSTWAHSGRENTFIVLDEVQNAIRMMRVSRSTNAERVQMGVEGLVSEGRKVGFNVAIAGQRATGLAGILSQTGKAIFRVEREEENAHKSLGGASGLQDGYFYARFGDVRLAGGFEPSDAEITKFLESRPVKPLERDWVDGRIVQTLLNGPVQEALPASENIKPVQSDIEKLAETIRGEWTPGMSKRGVGRLIGKDYAGSWAAKIDAIVEYLNSNNLEGVAG